MSASASTVPAGATASAAATPVERPTLAGHATSSHQYLNCVREAAAFVRASLGTAEMAIVLGSGLMDFVDKFSQSPPPQSLAYDQVPYMPGTNVPGHSGRIYVGDLPTKTGLSKVMCFAGRVHAYEGWHATEFNFIVRLAHACGVKVLLLTNSAGGALSGMTEGSIMMIEDHIRFSGINPLKDVCDDPRFGDRHATSSHAYSKRIQTIVKEAAAKLKMDVLSGTYCWTSGPSYETPAEVKAGQVLSVNSLGGAFGMSTVPEVLAAHNLGMEVFAVSLCTNLAAGLSDKELDHSDVKTVAEIAGPRFQNLLLETFANLDVQPDLAKKVLQRNVDTEHLLEVSAVPSHSLYPLVGWTPSLAQIQESAKIIDRLNTGAYPSELAALVVILGGRGQAAVTASFLGALTQTVTVPLRELLSTFKTNPDMLSSFARNAVLVLGTIAGEQAKRVAVVCSGDSNGVHGLSSAENSWLVQTVRALGASTVLSSAVGVATSNRGIGGVSASSSSAAAAPQVLLVQDVLDRQIDPLPLSALAPVASAHTAVFDLSLLGALAASVASAKLTTAPGAFLTFQGPMLPTEAELNLAFHGGAVAATGISNIGSLAEVAKSLGMRAAAVVSTVKHVTDIPAQRGAEHCAHSAALGHALVAALADPSVEHVASLVAFSPRNVSASPEPALAGFGPVALASHQEPFTALTASAAWVAAKIGASGAKTAVLVEGMLAEVFDETFKSEAEWPVLDVPNFARSVGITEETSGVPQSGACYPYDPRVILSSWVMRVGMLASGARILALVNTVDRTGLVPMFHGLNYIIRVLKLLESNGITNLLLLTPVASCSATVAPQSLVLVKDHINLTGLNPLFGENIPEMGPRFNDMSIVYKRGGIACFTAQPGFEGLTSLILGQVANPSLASLSEASLARAINCQAVVAGVAPVSTICKHMDTFVTCLGFVYRTAGSTDELAAVHDVPVAASIFSSTIKPEKKTMDSLRLLVNGAVDKLHDAGLVHLAAIKSAHAH